jgi:ATP synthase protein I
MGDDRFPESQRDDTDGDRKRLDDLGERVRKAREGAGRPTGGSTQHRDTAVAYRIMVEMIAGLGFGGFVGWWLDRWLETTPILLVAMILIGFAAGALNAYRAIRSYAGSVDGSADKSRE